jgi:tyrosyl-tRNA synthetase
MSKSLGTGIGLDESPSNMFGKTMALPDEAIIQVFIDCTYLPTKEIEELEKGLKAGANPRDLKMRLAYEIVKMYHSEGDAKRERENFIKTFSQKKLPTDIPEVKPSVYDIVTLLVEAKICKSKSEARQVVDQGGVKVNEVKVPAGEYSFIVKKGDIIQKGARFFVKVK